MLTDFGERRVTLTAYKLENPGRRPDGLRRVRGGRPSECKTDFHTNYRPDAYGIDVPDL